MIMANAREDLLQQKDNLFPFDTPLDKFDVLIGKWTCTCIVLF